MTGGYILMREETPSIIVEEVVFKLTSEQLPTSRSISGLTDTLIVDPENGDTMVWDAETEKWVNAAPASGSSDIIQTTFFELEVLIFLNGLNNGQEYAIADYRMVHRQFHDQNIDYENPDSLRQIYFVGEYETIVVKATSSNTISPIARSLDYPTDEIRFTMRRDHWYNDDGPALTHPANCLWLNKDGVTTEVAGTGIITDRTDTISKIRIRADWRSWAARNRFWDRGEDLVFFNYRDNDLWPYPLDTDEYVNAYLDIPFINVTTVEGQTSGAAEIDIDSHVNPRNDEYDDNQQFMPMIALTAYEIYKVKSDWGTDNLVLYHPNSHIGQINNKCCSKIMSWNLSEGDAGRFDAVDGFPNTTLWNFGGSVWRFKYQRGVQVNGNISYCEVHLGFQPDDEEVAIIHGDRSGVIFGPEITGPGPLSPELFDDPELNNSSKWYIDAGTVGGNGTAFFINGADYIEPAGDDFIVDANASYVLEWHRIDLKPNEGVIASIGGVSAPIQYGGLGYYRAVIQCDGEGTSKPRLSVSTEAGPISITRFSCRRVDGSFAEKVIKPPKNSYSSSVPTSNFDASQGYSRFSRHIKTDTLQLFECLDPSPGEAYWVEVTTSTEF